MIEFLADGSYQNVTISHGSIIAITVIALVIILAFYALRSIGLYMLAKKQELKCAIVAFIPLAWFYVCCKLLGKTRFFHWSYQKVALLLCIIFSVAELITLITNFLVFYPLIGNVLIGGKTIYIISTPIGSSSPYELYPWLSNIAYDATFVMPYSVQTQINIEKTLIILQYFTGILDLASGIIAIFVYINLFKKYWPQHFILASILSIFGLFAPFAFIIRKREPIDYNEYMRARYNMYYGNPYGPYGRPYGTRPPNAENPPEHPFKEFAERGEVDPGEPFEEFSNKSNPNSSPFEEFDDKK